MLPSVLPTDSDHVPVLAEEVVSLLDARPGETIVDGTFGAGGHSLLLASCLRGDGKVIAIDRDPAVAPFFARFRRETGVKARLHHGEFSAVLEAAERERRPGGRDPARPRRLFDAARSARPRLLIRGRRAARHAHGPELALLGARPRERRRRTRACRHLQALRRGAVRPSDRACDRSAPQVTLPSSARRTWWR